jgi:hypothetical protein
MLAGESIGPGLPRVSDGSLLFLLHLTKMRQVKDVRAQVLADVVLIADDGLQIVLGGVVEVLARLLEQEWLGVEARLLACGQFGQDGSLGRREDTVQPSQHHERQNDLPVVRLLVIAAQQLGDRPDERTEVLFVHACG